MLPQCRPPATIEHLIEASNATVFDNNKVGIFILWHVYNMIIWHYNDVANRPIYCLTDENVVAAVVLVLVLNHTVWQHHWCFCWQRPSRHINETEHMSNKNSFTLKHGSTVIMLLAVISQQEINAARISSSVAVATGWCHLSVSATVVNCRSYTRRMTLRGRSLTSFCCSLWSLSW